jgi:hypothetical protein
MILSIIAQTKQRIQTQVLRLVWNFETIPSGTIGLYAIGMKFNAGSSDSDKVGYTTRFVVK